MCDDSGGAHDGARRRRPPELPAPRAAAARGRGLHRRRRGRRRRRRRSRRCGRCGPTSFCSTCCCRTRPGSELAEVLASRAAAPLVVLTSSRSAADLEPSLARSERARLHRQARSDGRLVRRARRRRGVRAVRLLVWAAGGALCAAMSVNAVHGIWPPPEKAVVSYIGGVRRDHHRRRRVAAPAGQPHRHPADGMAVRSAAQRDADRLRRLDAGRHDRLRDELAGRADLRAPRPLVPERAAPLQARPGCRRARLRARGRVRARDRAVLRPSAAVRRDDHLVRAPRGADHASPRLGGDRPARRVRPVAASPRRALPRAARPQARPVDARRTARRPASGRRRGVRRGPVRRPVRDPRPAGELVLVAAPGLVLDRDRPPSSPSRSRSPPGSSGAAAPARASPTSWSSSSGRRPARFATRSRGRSATRRSSSRSGCPSGGRTSTRRAARSSFRRPEADRAVTVLGPADAPVAALVHDPVLLERRALLVSAGAAARLALENERLQAELRAQLAELRASREPASSAPGDEERRRLERDLHDGAQQRLLSLGLALQLARCEARTPTRTARASCLPRPTRSCARRSTSSASSRAASTRPCSPSRGSAPRSVARGALAGPGDDHASPTAPARARDRGSRLLRRLGGARERRQVRAGLARPASASPYVDGRLVVDVVDDGTGGADPSRGSGLRGLADRVHALDGSLELESPPGSGTRLHAEIPCG